MRRRSKNIIIYKLLTIIKWLLFALLILFYWQQILLMMIVISGIVYLTLLMFGEVIVKSYLWYDSNGGREKIKKIMYKLHTFFIK